MASDQLPDDVDYSVPSRLKRSSNLSFVAIIMIALVSVSVAVYTMLDRGAHTDGISTAESTRLAQLETNQAKLAATVDQLSKQYSELAARLLTLETKPSEGSANVATGPSAGDVRTYTVQAGDTLRKISTKMYGSSAQFKKIYDANRDQLKTPSSVAPGMVLQIPE